MLLMTAPTTEKPERTTTETKPLERKQKLVTLGRRVNNVAWRQIAWSEARRCPVAVSRATKTFP